MARLFTRLTTDEIAVVSNTTLNITSSFSIGAWFKTGTTGQYQSIINKDRTGNAFNVNYQLAVISTNVVFVRFGDGVGVFAANGTTVVTDNNWHYAMGIFDDVANTLKIYLDGTLEATTTGVTTVPVTNADPFDVGRWAANTLTFDGRLADIVLYSTVLTDNEVRSLSKGFSPAMIRPQDLRVYMPTWGFSPEGDLSRNRNNGTVVGTSVANHAPKSAYVIVPILGQSSYGVIVTTRTLNQNATLKTTISQILSENATIKTTVSQILSENAHLKQTISVLLQQNAFLKQPLNFGYNIKPI